MDMLNELLRAYKGIQKLFTPLLIERLSMNFSIEVMVLQPTSMPPIIILGGGATKTDNIKVGNNDLKCFFFGLSKKNEP